MTKTRSGAHRTRTTKKDLRKFREEEPLKEERLELDFHKGLTKAAEIAASVKKRPVLIAVFGYPDSGKSHFISNLLERLAAKGIVTVGYHSTAGTAAFDSIKTPKSETQVKPDGFIFHCGHMREKDNKKSPDFLANEVLGCGIDVSIVVYNPSMHKVPEGEYDLIICNPSSYKKKQ